MRSILAGCLLFVLLAPHYVTSFAAEDDTPPKQVALSFHPKPLDRCRWFLLSEFGWAMRGNDWPDGAHPGTGKWCLFGDVGLMKNISRNTAIGLTGFATGGDTHGHVGLRFRWRRWLPQDSIRVSRISLNISPGLLLSGPREYINGYYFVGPWPDVDEVNNGTVGVNYPGLVCSVDMTFHEWVAFVLHAEYVRLKPLDAAARAYPWPSSDFAIYLGAKTGSFAGPTTFIALFVAVGIALASGT